jgi:N6-L-threonylcarbamoyladenine synthase/protein kinase Bud32
MAVVGIEGTAWAASAAAVEPAAVTADGPLDPDAVRIRTRAYEPDSGGIHPREAAEHMRTAIPAVVDEVLDTVDTVDAVAFSRGPGLGPCLRIAGSAARALAGTLDVPLVGVNHMVAHAEIGRRVGGATGPVCLNASGANAHVLVRRGDRYRVLGETLDTGIGNAIDKFARHCGQGHPGGPWVEEQATAGDYLDLPYVVKGMDLSFAGLVSAAQDAIDNGAPVPDVCFALQEHAFAMLTEVSERALALAERDALVLGGGVAHNERLQGMLRTMCDRRGATLHVPPSRFLGDNAGMIAVCGAAMHAAGDTIPIDDSAVRPDWRPDEVPLAWATPDAAAGSPHNEPVQGAEATVTLEGERVRKRREPRGYRVDALDERLRRERTGLEARVTATARGEGVPTPVVQDANPYEQELLFERVGDVDLADHPAPERVARAAGHLARLHDAGIVHGDPTTRNARVGDRTWLIDFGLAYHSQTAEDRAMDLHVLRRSLAGTVANGEALAGRVLPAYADAAADLGVDPDAVRGRLREIEGRGRYRSDGD